ncbi:histone-lysine N-methyltransferase SETMAR [Trichonephila clavipes]|nr:histone-lysine N-methyltransferase SETMAR [Trichonephila clavipes]
MLDMASLKIELQGITNMYRSEDKKYHLPVSKYFCLDNVFRYRKVRVTGQRSSETARIGQQNMGVLFHQDNARPKTSIVTRQNLWELGWEDLMHPPYSPELTPSDYHLFLVLQNFLSDKKLGSREDC